VIIAGQVARRIAGDDGGLTILPVIGIHSNKTL
jgi:hypothetical protein